MIGTVEFDAFAVLQFFAPDGRVNRIVMVTRH